ncbi:hypothetical protein HU200_028104 [Digitaria exilis]|uniref:Uncharacterized protein n=1 Tax=Digitaria exilis TaxID=1010633 RepID=A0A835EQI0_9POAL|nr:hypothetical protein HU200_028104 [Digitaria exilis]
MNEPERNGLGLLNTFMFFIVGFIIGADWYEDALREAVVKRILFLD